MVHEQEMGPLLPRSEAAAGDSHLIVKVQTGIPQVATVLPYPQAPLPVVSGCIATATMTYPFTSQ